MRRSLVLALPICAAMCALAIAAAAPVLGVILVVLVLIAALVGERLDVDQGRQWVTSLVGGGLGFSIATLLFEPIPSALGRGWTRAGAALLMGAAARLILREPVGGTTLTLALATGGMIAAGEARMASRYGWLVAIFLVLMLVALRHSDAHRPPLAKLSRRSIGIAILIVASGASIGVGSAVGLRQSQAWMSRRLELAFLQWRNQTGFADAMELGALDRLLDSDRIVMRIRGPAVDYLRGTAFDVYENGRWLRSEHATAASKKSKDIPGRSEDKGSKENGESRENGEDGKSDTSTGAADEGRTGLEAKGDASATADDVLPMGPGVTEIELVGERLDRFFLPMDARQIGVIPGPYSIDAFGIAKPPERFEAATVRFYVGARDRGVVVGPTWEDTHLQRRIRGEASSIGRSWTVTGRDVEEKLDLIERRLAAENSYSRTFERDDRRDPVLDFIGREHHGHCEYFASAMALLARGAGIPARVVTGYRVAEYNGLGRYWVVREKNAHAWVEAWVEGKGWVTRDPTPPEAIPQDQRHEAGWLTALWDVSRLLADRFLAWLSERTLGQTAIAIAVGLLALVAIIARGMRRAASDGVLGGDDTTPLACMTLLTRALERRGLAREPSESLESFARRLPADASWLVDRYAALRYGGIGDEPTLTRDIEGYVRSQPSRWPLGRTRHEAPSGRASTSGTNGPRGPLDGDTAINTGAAEDP